MAVRPRTVSYTASPQRREILLDLNTTPPREDVARAPFFELFLGEPDSERLPLGAGVNLTGNSQRINARDRILSDRLLAILQRNAPARQKAAELLQETSEQPPPTTREIEALRRQALFISAPFALEEKIIDLDKIQEQINASRALTPVTIALKTAEANRQNAEAQRRAAEAENLIALRDVAAERELAEAEFLRARAAAEALQPQIFDLATGGLDFFSKQVLARELTRVAAGERPFFAPVERRRRTITSF